MTLKPRIRVGGKIGGDLTVIGMVDKSSGRHPVYIAWSHTDWCPVACKVYETMARAEHEAKVLFTLNHPNIIRVLGAAPPGVLVTEFLEGPTLHRLIRDCPGHRMEVSDAMRVAIHIGAALAHIHRRGAVHLDVKPTNVIITAGRPVLFDMEAVRALGSPRPQQVMGTGPFIAPEECELRDVTPAADVFSLCATLYQMITGDIPFAVHKAGRRYPQTHKDAMPPHVLRDGLDPVLSELLMAGLARDPAARPTLPDLLLALNVFIADGGHMWPDTLHLAVKPPAAPRRGRQAPPALPAPAAA